MAGGRIRAVAIVVALATACGGADDGTARDVPVTTDAESTTTSTTLPPMTTTSAAPTTTVFAFGFDQALISKVWADYEAAIDAMEHSSSEADPEDPLLDQHLAGGQLEHWRQVQTERRAAGQHASFPADTQHREQLIGVGIVSSSQIDIRVCTYDDAVVSVRSTGETIDDRAGWSWSSDSMVKTDGEWKFAGRNIRPARENECPAY